MKSNYIRDAVDTNRKVNQCRGMAHNNPVEALKMAKAIAENVSLLSGLTAVVQGLVKHAEALEVLAEVAARPGVRKKYQNVYNAIVRAQAEAAFN